MIPFYEGFRREKLNSNILTANARFHEEVYLSNILMLPTQSENYALGSLSTIIIYLIDLLNNIDAHKFLSPSYRLKLTKICELYYSFINEKSFVDTDEETIKNNFTELKNKFKEYESICLNLMNTDAMPIRIPQENKYFILNNGSYSKEKKLLEVQLSEKEYNQFKTSKHYSVGIIPKKEPLSKYITMENQYFFSLLRFCSSVLDAFNLSKERSEDSRVVSINGSIIEIIHIVDGLRNSIVYLLNCFSKFDTELYYSDEMEFSNKVSYCVSSLNRLPKFLEYNCLNIS